MSWQVSSFGLVAAVLVGGAVWYERTRPSAKLVAAVAALAALAVAGRVALAPVPNVVATTDIVLLSGYALGGAPGFAVGALAALVSNFWLGQGPWTPWQMAGWGLIGIGGSALAALTARRLGRVGLAIACGLAGLAYGALLDLSVMVTYGGEQSLERYLALSARAIPFNVAHAAGNVVFALIAGPALVAMLSRFRARLEVSWRDASAPPRAGPAGPAEPRRAGATLAAALVLALGCAAAIQATSAVAAGSAGAAKRWLLEAENRDGGYGADPGDESGVAMTTWAALGIEAAGVNPLDRGRSNPIAFLRAHAGSIRSPTDLERTILAVDAAGVDARSFAGRDLVAELLRRRDRDGAFDDQLNPTAFAVIALRAAGTPRSRIARSARWVRAARNRDGGWGFSRGAPSDADSTGAALQALAAAGNGGPAARAGVRYLRRTQRRDGGWPLAGGGSTNSQSTAWAVQGLLAVGVDPAKVRTRGRSPLDYLDARQASDGHYRYSSASDQTPVWVTAQALMAAAREPLPLAAVARRARPEGDPSALRASPPGPAAEAPGPGVGGTGAVRSPAPRTDGAGSRPKAGADTGRAEGERVASGRPREEPAGEPLSATRLPGTNGEDNLGAYVGAGLGLLALALTAGFLWYRRRLP